MFDFAFGVQHSMHTMESDSHLDQKFQAPLAQLPVLGLEP